MKRLSKEAKIDTNVRTRHKQNKHTKNGKSEHEEQKIPHKKTFLSFCGRKAAGLRCPGLSEKATPVCLVGEEVNPVGLLGPCRCIRLRDWRPRQLEASLFTVKAKFSYVLFAGLKRVSYQHSSSADPDSAFKMKADQWLCFLLVRFFSQLF